MVMPAVPKMVMLVACDMSGAMPSAVKLAAAIPFSEAGVTVRETKDLWNLPLVFLVLLTLRFSEWWLRRKWGIV